MKWNVSPDDVSRGKLIEKPGWYTLEIVAYKEDLAKNKESMNAIFDFKVQSDDKGANGIVIRHWFNEKAAGMSVPFLLALGAEEQEDGSFSAEFGPHLVGEKVQGYIKRGDYDGKPVNQIAEFAPLS